MDFRLTLAVALLGIPAMAGADYVAWSVFESARTPLPENIDSIDAKHLVNVAWSDFDGRRSRVGVLEVDNTSNSSTINFGGGSIDFSDPSRVPVDGIEAIVIDAMNRSNRFRLLERAELEKILGEQDLATSGRVSKPSGPKTGKVLGAEYLVQFVVTDYEAKVKGQDFGGLGGLLGKKVPIIGGVKFENSEGRVGMNIRLINAETSEIAFSKQIESTIKESGVDFGAGTVIGDLGLGGFVSNFAKTPIGQAVIAGINEGVYELVKQIGVRPAEGSIVKADTSSIYINMGADQVSVGERLTVYSEGEQLIDPETGLSLGGSRSDLGQIEITKTEEKFSIARSVNLSAVPARGDPVISDRTPGTMEFASSWKAPR